MEDALKEEMTTSWELTLWPYHNKPTKEYKMNWSKH